MSYETKVIDVKNIDEMLCQLMASVYLSHYDCSNNELFRNDLKEKQKAILLYNNNQLVGFTTFLLFDYTWNNKNIKVLFSGDTIVDRKHWGQQALAFAWIKQISEYKLLFSDQTFYWFLLVKGHRTYKYLPTFALSWFPSWLENRIDLQDLAQQLATKRYGDLYNREKGIVRFPQSRGQLKNDIAYPEENELSNQAVKFFLEKNPLFFSGDELVCICELEPSNMRSIALRIFNKVQQKETELSVTLNE